MKVYSPAETASLLNIKTATLRKYSLLLEKQGYEIERNSKKHRYYRDKDVITLRSVITASNSGETLLEAVNNVVHLRGYNNESNAIDNDKKANDNDIRELKEMMLKQNDLIFKLIERLEEQEDYLNKRIEEKIIDTTKQIEITASKDNEKKKGLLARMFKK